MSKFKVAHIREQGVNLIIIPLDTAFGRQSHSEQQGTMAALQSAASSAGLAGTVVPVWLDGIRHSFIAPRQWHAFFQSFSWNQIMANINKELTVY